MRVKYNTDTQLFFQIGDPLDQGCAAYLHNAMYEFANLNAVCMPAVVKKGELGKFIEAAKTLDAKGFDITMPHKTDILDYLDECDPASEAFRCVNHVNIVNGRLVGKGLDGEGMALSIKNELADTLRGRKVLMIGAGAVSGPIAASLCEYGIGSVTVVNRTVEKAQYIADTLARLYGVDCSYGPLENDFLCAVAPEITLAVQCTSLGSGHGRDFDSLEFVSRFPQGCVAADVLYPMTTFLGAAKKRGMPTIDGRGMLFQQQLAMMEFHFGVKLPDEALLEAEEAVEIAIAMRSVRNRRMEKNKRYGSND